MKYLLFFIISIISQSTLEGCYSRPKQSIILDAKHFSTGLPDNFRKSDDPFASHHEGKSPSRKGLDDLRASGSGQFSKKGLPSLLRAIKEKENLIIVDLRQESHGFVNKAAVSWYAKDDSGNAGKSLDQIIRTENSLLQGIKKTKRVKIKDYSKKRVRHVSNEKALTKKHKVKYFRIPVQDYEKPTQTSVNRFISFVKSIRKSSKKTPWLHFHCEAGKGRTTTFLTMYDMMHNAHKASFKDILARQHLIGGRDLLHLPSKNAWNHRYALARKKFIKRFYKYCKQESPLFRAKWSDWCKKQ